MLGALAEAPEHFCVSPGMMVEPEQTQTIHDTLANLPTGIASEIAPLCPS